MTTPPRTAPRIVASDLDGTLLAPDGTVSARTVAALAACADAGVVVVFVTARPHRWLVELAPHVAGHGVAICANGASVVDVGAQRVLEQHGMDRDRVAAVAARLRAVWGADVHLAAESARGFAAERAFVSAHERPAGSPVAARIEDVADPTTLKLLVRVRGAVPAAGPDGFVAALQEAVGDLAHVSTSVSGTGTEALGEIAAPGVTKAATLARWAARQDVPADDVWAVGDAPNDLPMLTWAGRSFAVANAHPHVRAVVDEVVPSNADDGVAHVLERAAGLARRVAAGRAR
ncbi:HAD family hydrolase [Cellulomonas shaoxiangyii]|uniref:HAD family phosphatase n=1 Tax=Cellulomonas shaoxiangyii TaxID=2566013 RepID=A0A4V1CMV6_9CELL|nr:HAD family hydrolase [Cellulomonas shaoxiangyii]QCB94275.1 HAD family phosphatase [Cellulomonas shaoxiangyii]TGY82645.1 HAD family phosphatase [Cellulomonas shaoxiangyii]